MENAKKELGLALLRKAYRMLKNDESPITDESLELLKAMCDRPLNKTEAAKYLNISVSTFNHYLVEGRIPPGTKKQNECLKWRTADLDKVKMKE